MDAEYAQDHPSPTKKRRTSPTDASTAALPFSLPGLAQPPQPAYQPQTGYAAPSQPSAYNPVPAPVALLALAVSLRSAAHSLLPQLSKRPASSSPSSNARYAYAWQSYTQSLVACVAALRAAAEVCRSSGEWRGMRLELRVNAMLAEQLVEMYEEDEEGMRKVAGEAEEALAKAHPSLHPYQPPLLLLQSRLSLATSKPLKHTRQLLRRLLSSLPAVSSSSTPAQAAAYYAVQSLSATLPHVEVSDAERSAAWRTVANAAQQRRDGDVALVATLAEARLVLEAEDFSRCSFLLAALESVLGGEGDVAGVAREARIMWRLMKTIVLAQTDVKAARDMLKGTHRLLDAQPAAAAGAGGDTESGTVKAVILPATAPTTATPTSTPPSASLTFHLPSHSTLYPFTFHLSAALHLDPLGRSPRSLLFGAEGLRGASARLNARDAPPPGSALRKLGDVQRELERTSRLKVGLHLSCARLRTMRGEYGEAEEEIKAAVQTARGWGFWDGEGEEGKETREAVTLAWGLNRLARAARDGEDEKEAERCFEAVIASSAPPPPASGKKPAKDAAEELNPRRAQGRKIAMLSLLLLRMSAPALSAGGVEAIPSFAAGSPFPSPTKAFPSPSPSPVPVSPAFPPSASTPSASASANYTSLTTLLSSLLRTPLQSLLDAHPPRPPTNTCAYTPSDLIELLAHAVTAREITGLKKALSGALTATNELQSNWVRVGVLGILGSVFGWTREGEAHKMLLSSYKLAASMAPPTRTISLPSSSASPTFAAAASSLSIFPGAAPAETTVKKDAAGGESKVQVGYARMQAWAGERLLETYRLTPSLASPAQVQEMERAVRACKVWMEGVDRELGGSSAAVKGEGVVKME
ncbi:hypothetical protein JCM6882_001697 [Rhodosporidiobolus microsporus]